MLTARILLLLADAEPATELSRDYRKLLLQVQHEHELTIAAQIQRALLPQSRYGGLGFEIAAMSVPCRAIGGDCFDYFNVSGGPFAFVLGDVAGKGPPAALLAAMLQARFGAAPRGGEAISAAAAMKAASCRRSARLMNPAYHDSCQYETLTDPGTSGGNT